MGNNQGSTSSTSTNTNRRGNGTSNLLSGGGFPKNSSANLNIQKMGDEREGNGREAEAEYVSSSAVGEEVEEQRSFEKPNSALTLDFKVELGGGKGWPKNANIILYHHELGLIIVGTENGTLYEYGDGFQYLQIPCAEQTDITNIVCSLDEKILISFDDNSLAVVSLPALNYICGLQKSWLHPYFGDVTVLYVDELHDRNFAYVGTSAGFIRILEILHNSIRECDYFISSSEVGLSEAMVVSDLQICPKDERYLAIGYDGSSINDGLVAIFDLQKKKPLRSYKTFGVTSLCWTHDGELLFAGTRMGEIVSCGLDKQFCISIWNTKTQIIDDDDINIVTIVRKVRWMAPQLSTEEGCLFVLIGAFGSETENLKSVIIGLRILNQGNLEQIFSVPPLSNEEEVVGFRIVPMIDKENPECTPVPALLLLTQSDIPDSSNISREMRLIKCPSTSIKDWVLEEGFLPAPRHANEVLPGITAVTAIYGIPADNDFKYLSNMAGYGGRINNVDDLPNQLAPELLSKSSRRVSMRDFLSGFEEIKDSWEMVLSCGDCPNYDLQDVIFVGHEDGSIIVWGVSRPPIEENTSMGKSNSWLPLASIRCGYSKITSIKQIGHYLIAGDESGVITIWESEYRELHGVNQQFFVDKMRGNVEYAVTAVDLEVDSKIIILGNIMGQVYLCTNWLPNELQLLNSLSKSGGSGEILHLLISLFWKNGSNIPSFYVFYKSNHLAVVSLHSREILTCFNGQLINRGFYSSKVVLAFMTNSLNDIVCRDSVSLNSAEDTSTLSVTHLEESLEDCDPSHQKSKAAAKLVNVSSFVNTFKKVGKKSQQLDENNTIDKVGIPHDCPRYLHYVLDREIISFDLFAQKNTPNITRQTIAGNRLIAANLVSYIKDQERFFATPFKLLSVLDCEGNLLIYMLGRVKPIAVISVLPLVLLPGETLDAAVILNNGQLYMKQTDKCLFSATVSSSEYVQTALLPSRGCTRVTPIPDNYKLKMGKDPSQANSKAKRRSSFIVGSTPVDLDKLFNKTWNHLQKDELLSGAQRQQDIERNEIRKALSTADNSKLLTETREAFVERGERIERINKKMEDFANAAKDYKRDTASHKAKMKQKAARWGLF